MNSLALRAKHLMAAGAPARGMRACLARFPSLARFRVQESGIAAVEFSLILPILLVLWIGGVEVTSALSVDRKLNNLASALGDLTARSIQLTDADINDLFKIRIGAMKPFYTASRPNEIGMRITAVKMDAGGSATVAWTRSSGTIPAQGALNTIVPATLRVPSTQIIMTEVHYNYSPVLGYVITGDIELQDRMFFVPRLVTAVKLCNTANPPVCQS